MDELIREMNPWWEKAPECIGIRRDKYLSMLEKNFPSNDLVFITGLRRVGKSTILKQFIHTLITGKKIDPKHICYLSIDAYQFRDSSILGLVREFRKIHSLRINEMVYLFIDEVNAKDSFKQELKTLYDLGKAKIFASASSATLLIDKGAHLTGRSRVIEIEPLDFTEFLLFKKYDAKQSERYLLENYFEKYLELGGMPEYVLTEDPSYITNLVDNIIYKDIVAVHGLKNPETIKDLFKLLCERVGKQLSYNKIGRILGINKDSVKKYLGYFVDCYLFYVIEKEGKLNERLSDNKKVYCADIGIKNVTTGFRDLGAIFENLVFLRIRKHHPRYIKEFGIELDFAFEDTLIEVKYGSSLTDKQQKLFNNFKAKKKIVVAGAEYFLGDDLR